MKKWLKRIVLGLLAIFALLYSFLMIRSHTPVPVHDEELRLERTSIPAGSNAFDVLAAAGTNVWLPDKQSLQFYDLARDTNWDDSLASTLLASNREALAAWDAAAKMPDFQVPEATNFDADLTYLAVWKYRTQLAEVRENFLMRHGHETEAFDYILSDIQLTHRMQNSHGVLITYLVSVAIGNMALSQIPHWLGKTHLDANQLKNFLQQLSFDPNDDGIAYANTIKSEYKCLSGTLEALRDGKSVDARTGAYNPHPSTLLPLFNFSQTKAMFADFSLRLVDTAPHHYNEAQLPDLASNRPSLISMILSGNVYGQILYYMAAPDLLPSLAKKSQVDVQFQATRVILALRAYQLGHGQLPANLSALVPEFLDKVPTDDFDGQPLRYSAGRKIVYSVGKNLKDDGGDGSRGNPSHPPLDQVCHFDF